jgi:hypothetical protein
VTLTDLTLLQKLSYEARPVLACMLGASMLQPASRSPGTVLKYDRVKSSGVDAPVPPAGGEEEVPEVEGPDDVAGVSDVEVAGALEVVDVDDGLDPLEPEPALVPEWRRAPVLDVAPAPDP